MIPSSACPSWPPDRAANAAQDHRSYTTPWDTIHGRPGGRAPRHDAPTLAGTFRAAAPIALVTPPGGLGGQTGGLRPGTMPRACATTLPNDLMRPLRAVPRWRLCHPARMDAPLSATV